MDRCAIFVDAGYLLAEAGDLLFDTLDKYKRKIRPSCDYKKLLAGLESLACEHCSLPILRTYWYDGSHNGFPTEQHQRIARLPNVKVRLGRIIGSQQKGVDALIYRDLMTLARERALATGYLLSGDEDLREGVIAAQDMGVRMVLLGIPSRRDSNQSSFLIQEADDHIIFEKEIWQSYFSPPKPPNYIDAQPITRTQINQAKEIGRKFAADWCKANEANLEQIRELNSYRQSRFRRIPQEIDVELLEEAQQTFGSLEGEEKSKRDLKRSLRDGFWEGIPTSNNPEQS